MQIVKGVAKSLPIKLFESSYLKWLFWKYIFKYSSGEFTSM